MTPTNFRSHPLRKRTSAWTKKMTQAAQAWSAYRQAR